MAGSEPKLRELFSRAAECQSAEEQAAYLDQACQGNAELRAQLDELLQAHREAGSFLQEPSALQAGTIDLPAPAERPGTVIGPYKLLQQIGEGGMGTVWMAEQTEPVKRKVALKVIKPGMDSQQVIARFEAERQALAMMDHVNIARVFDAGATEAGRPYFVMELVHGVPITKYCDDNHLTPRARLELFVPVCQAIQHAHHKGIIHRDVKPSNVLVTLYDGKPVPKVIDFGVAKATEQRLTERTLFTQYGALVGTPQYMSPEQAEMSALGVDTRSDIYSLGVLLYELLTGSTPLSHKRLKEAAYAEVLRMIKEEEPPRPSTRLSDSGEALASISANRHTEPAKLTKLVRGELDWIVLKALEKDRNRRYETAKDFAADVQRYLNDEPVQACPPSAWYRFGKFARRRKAAIVTAAAILVAVMTLAGVVGSTLQERAGRRARTAEAAGTALEESEKWQRQSRLREAMAAARRALAALVGGADETRRRRVQDRVIDLEAVEKLDDIRLKRSPVKNGPRYSVADVEADYAKAFQHCGIDVEALEVEAAAERIRARTVAVELADGLFEWAKLRHTARKQDDGGGKHLNEVARAADPDKRRNQVREALWTRDRQALKELAAAGRIEELSPATLVLLAESLRSTGAVEEAVALLRRACLRHSSDFWVNHRLAFCLADLQPPPVEERIRYATSAAALRPESGLVQLHLALALLERGPTDEALAGVRRAIDLQPDLAPAHLSLGVALERRGQLPEAAACYQATLDRKPDYARAHCNLGNVLLAQGKPAEAADRYRQAIDWYRKSGRPDPEEADAHFNLGIARERLKNWAGAADAYRQAIAGGKADPDAHSNLARNLRQMGETDDAISHFREAIKLRQDDLDGHLRLIAALLEQRKAAPALAAMRQAFKVMPPTDVRRVQLELVIRSGEQVIAGGGEPPPGLEGAEKDAHASVERGNALYNQRKLPEAATAYQEAIDHLPRYAGAHYNLANVLREMGQLPEAIAAYRRAVALAPDYAEAYENLGIVLAVQGKLDDAVDAFRAAVKHKAGHAPAHVNLGMTRIQRGEFAQGLADLKKGRDLMAPTDPTRPMLDETIRDCSRLVRLDGRLPAVLRGKDQPADNPERLDFIEVCRFKSLPAAAARLYQEVFAAEPGHAADLRSGKRYAAAGAAALAGGGQGKDLPPLDEKTRTRWRRQAREWLAADLEQWGRLLDRPSPQVRAAAGQALSHWQRDPKLAGVRDTAALARLPKAERDAWLDLWADVEALLVRLKLPAKEMPPEKSSERLHATPLRGPTLRFGLG